MINKSQPKPNHFVFLPIFVVVFFFFNLFCVVAEENESLANDVIQTGHLDKSIHRAAAAVAAARCDTLPLVRLQPLVWRVLLYNKK